MMHLYRFTRDSVVGKPRAAEGPRSLAGACATWFAAVLGMLATWATSPAVRAQSMAANNLMAATLNNSGFTTANITMGGNVTVEGWVYHTGAWDSWTRMVEMTYTTFDLSNSMNFVLSSGSTGKPFMEIWAGSTQSTLTAPNAIPLNTWTHVAFVISGNTFTIYVNGTSVATGTGTAASSLSRRISIGRNFNGGNAINGHLADVRIWSVARSATEINASMPVGSVTGATTGLVAAWPFGATGAAVLGDVSGNNRTLSEQGTVYYWKGGSGTLVSTGQNSYAGLLTIWSGTLQVGNGGTAGTLGSGSVINNSVLAFNRSDTVSVSALSGTGKLVMSGSGTLNVPGANTFTGGMEANAGTMRLGAGGSGSFSSVSGNTLTINNSASVYFDANNLFGGHGSVPANDVVINSGGVLDSGNSVFNLLPALTLNGGTLRSSGTISSYPYALRGGVVVNGGANSSVISATSVGLGSVAVAGTTFDVADGSADADLLVSGTLVDGPGASYPTSQVSYLTKTGAGTMVLSGANTYSGVTTISAGTLQVGNGGTTGNLGTGSIVNNGTLTFHRSDNLSLGTAVSGTGSLRKLGGNTLTVTANQTFTGSTLIDAGTLQVGNGGTVGSLASSTIVNNATLAYHRSDDITLSAVISGTGAMTKSGAGTLTVVGANTYSGVTTISAGTLRLGDGGTTGSLGSGDVVNNGTLAYNRIDDLTLPGAISGTGALTKSGAGTLTIAGANTYSGGTTISAGTLQVGSGGATGSLGSGSVVNNGTLRFNRTGSFTASSISGPGKVIMDGSGTLTLSSGNNFAGGLEANAGTVRLAASSTFSSAAGNTLTINNGATIVYAASDAFGNHSGVPANAIVINSGGALDAENNRFNLLPALTLNGGTLRATGAVGAYSYALRGNVTVNGGANSSVISANSVGLGSVALAGTTFDVADGVAAVDLLVSGTLINGPSAAWPTPQASFLTKTGAGTMVLSGNNTYSGVTTISAGTLQVGNGGTSGALGSGAVVNNGALVFNRSDSLSLGSAVSGSGSLRKLGANTLTLTGNHTFSGSTTIEAGTLQVGNGGTSGSLASSAIVNNGTLGHNRSDDVALTATISGTGALTKSGSGTLTLSGANTYSGVTTVSAGTLQVGDGGTTGTTGSGAVVNNGLLILNRSDAITIAGALSGTGGLSKRGAGVASLASGSTLQGDIDVTGGTLVLPASGTVSSPAIRVSAGATLDASLRPAGLSLGSSQTLLNVGGSATLLGSADASSGGLALSYSAGTPAFMVGNGVIVLSSATTLRITNSGPALGRGNYRIISKLPGGSVEGTLPAVAVEGGGIVSGGLAKLAIVSGELILTVNAVSLNVSSTQPPDVIFHQGYLTDATGSPLGTPNPKNYDVAFRLYTSATGGSPVWGERQVVTVDGGRFGVHLGDGDPYLGDPSTALSSVFIANDAALYLETTVRGGGTDGADLVLSPRAILAPNPYAFLSRHARGAGNLVNSSNQAVLSVVGTRVGINNAMPASALDVAGSVRVTNVIGSGTASVGGTITAQRFEGRGIVPVGGIIVWSGTTPPEGWALCDGRVAKGRRTPDLRGRFVLGTGAGTGLTARAAGQVGGAETVTLTEAQMPQHRHVVDVPLFMTSAAGGHNHSNKTGAGSGEGLGKDDDQNHWFDAGAYIIRNRSGGSGSHNHFVDIPSFRVGAVGGGKPQNNLPPFYAMAFIMRVE